MYPYKKISILVKPLFLCLYSLWATFLLKAQVQEFITAKWEEIAYDYVEKLFNNFDGYSQKIKKYQESAISSILKSCT